VKDERVLIKMHTANNIGYSTIHPVFVRKVVQAVKDGGGRPFVADVWWDTAGAEMRGYSAESLGCPVYPIAGPDEKYCYDHPRPYKNIQSWKVAGLAQDATFLVNFAHVKGIRPMVSVQPSRTWPGLYGRGDARPDARLHAL